jgi:hypothetical protein
MAVVEIPIRTKTPGEYLFLDFDWSDYLLSGETISTSVLTLETITGDTNPPAIDGETVTTVLHEFYLAGGSVPNEYTITDAIVTTPQAREIERSIEVHLVTYR